MPVAVATPVEVERFAHCAHAWHLGRQEAAEDRADGIARGVAAHRRIAGLVHEAQHARDQSTTAMRWSLRVLTVAAAATLLTVESAATTGGLPGLLYLVASLVVLNCSVGLLTLGLFDERKARRIQKTLGLDEPPELDPDAPPAITDPAWGLEGDRGSALHTDGRVIPIDARTGATPRRPRTDHTLHMAARLRLQEVHDGRAPGYGLIAYPDGVFRVDWGEGQKAALRAVLDRMRTGDADRDHTDPRRCRSCTFRPACSQAVGRAGAA